MFKPVLPPLKVFVTLTVVMMLLKPLFMVFNGAEYAEYGFFDALSVMFGGLRMDASMAAYLTVVPAFLSIVSIWTGLRKWLLVSLRVWFGVSAFLISVVFVLDTVLYGYWGFKLDTTPLFYFSSSPSLALASASAWEIAGGLVATTLLATSIYLLLDRIGRLQPVSAAKRGRQTAVAVFATGLLFIPIRGGFSVSTMNLSAAYFSSDRRLNHAAVNPMFSLIYSATHVNDLSSAFLYYDEETAMENMNELNRNAASSDTVAVPLLANSRPDICIIILESFSNHLFPSLGGESVATELDSIARSGLLFERIYASGFRTDRGIPAILSGYPAQPTTSVMKDVAKAETLPSIAGVLADAGYDARYYYGGDDNFTNMRAYLMSSGFSEIVNDKSFPLSQRLSKWGVPDGPVFQRALDDLLARTGNRPLLTVIQTSSSHEPFDVPRSPRKPDELKAVTAFQYADSCAAAFINNLTEAGKADNTLFILVPDHYGSYPKGLERASDRHSIPIIMTGGALQRRGRVGRTGGQTDIAATILGAMGLDTSSFRFSHNLLDPDAPGYSFFSDPGEIGLVTDSATVVYDLDAGETTFAEGDTARLARMAKSYLQILYRDLDAR